MHYSAGARVASDSWGTTDTTYSTLCLQADRFLWQAPDYVSFVAAGNDGERCMADAMAGCGDPHAVTHSPQGHTHCPHGFSQS